MSDGVGAEVVGYDCCYEFGESKLQPYALSHTHPRAPPCTDDTKHADILSDLAAALAGSIGIAPTSNLDPTRKNPSMFEPIHGSAFDITGKGVANPVATFWTASEMLIWLGEEDAAKKLMDCVEAVTERGVRTRDLGGNAGTKEVTEAVCGELERVYKVGKKA